MYVQRIPYVQCFYKLSFCRTMINISIYELCLMLRNVLKNPSPDRYRYSSRWNDIPITEQNVVQCRGYRFLIRRLKLSVNRMERRRKFQAQFRLEFINSIILNLNINSQFNARFFKLVFGINPVC